MICATKMSRTAHKRLIRHTMEPKSTRPILEIKRHTSPPQMLTIIYGYLTNSTSKRSRKSNATSVHSSSRPGRLARSAKLRLVFTIARSAFCSTMTPPRINFIATSAVSAKLAEGVTFSTVRLAGHVFRSRPWTSISTERSNSARTAIYLSTVTSSASRWECAAVTRSTGTAFRFWLERKTPARDARSRHRFKDRVACLRGEEQLRVAERCKTQTMKTCLHLRPKRSRWAVMTAGSHHRFKSLF